MVPQDLIQIDTLCLHYKIEVSFFDDLESIGLIQVETFEQKKFINQDKISDLEIMIRLYHELNVNMEGIDIVLNFLQKEIALQEEINFLKNRLKRYEND